MTITKPRFDKVFALFYCIYILNNVLILAAQESTVLDEQYFNVYSYFGQSKIEY